MGSSVTWNGTTFVYAPPNLPNGLSSTTLSLAPGSFTSLSMLALGVDGNQPSQTFTVTYSDGTQSISTQSLSDWGSPQNCPGAGPYYVYGYSIPVNSSKIVSSLTLPSNSHVVIISVQDEQ